MKIRNLTELNDYLDKDLGWRKKELTSLTLMIGRLRVHEKRAFLRAALCILYAHWEGFIKAAATYYVAFVGTKGLRYRDLTPNFVAMGLRPRIISVGQSRRSLHHTELVAYLLSDLSDKAEITSDDAINTESNLDSKVLLDILCSLGIDDIGYRTKGPLIDQRLLNARNNIAHGRGNPIDEKDYTEIHTEIILLIDQFRSDVENAAVQELYRRSVSN